MKFKTSFCAVLFVLTTLWASIACAGGPWESGITELIGINEQVDANEYCASVSVALKGGLYPGLIYAVQFTSNEAGTGAVQTPAGVLYIFDADPAVANGDAALAAAGAEHATAIGIISIVAGDWASDANGGCAYVITSIPFHSLKTLYFTFRPTTAVNDAAGDDEQIRMNIWYVQN